MFVRYFLKEKSEKRKKEDCEAAKAHKAQRDPAENLDATLPKCKYFKTSKR